MASDGWYEPAIDNHARGTMPTFTGPVEIGVLHTTESSRFVPNATSYFGHTSYPHFTVAVERGVFKCWQHISIRKAAKALANRPGGVQTGREGCIQIEVVGRAVEPFTDDPVMVEGLTKLMRWIESQTLITPTCDVKFLPYPSSYGNKQGQRLSNSAWTKYRGWLGHQHVPENTHGDPGAIDIKKLLGKPSGSLHVAPSNTTAHTKEIDMVLVLDGDDSTQYLCTDKTKRRVGPSQSNVYQAGGVVLVGKDHDKGERVHTLSKLEEVQG